MGLDNYKNQVSTGLQGFQQAQDCAVERRREVPELLDNIQSVADSIHGLLGTLEERLQCVSQSEPPVPCKPECADRTPARSTVMESLRQHGRTLTVARDRIQVILKLLEV